MSNLRAAATAEYESLCERLFREWLVGGLSRQNLGSVFSTDHCPEPYLDFLPGDDPLIYVTHNPGRGEPFQLRAAVDTPASPIVSRETYRENARRLAAWYSGGGSLKISAAARTRIRPWESSRGNLVRGASARSRSSRSTPIVAWPSSFSPLICDWLVLSVHIATYVSDTYRRERSLSPSAEARRIAPERQPTTGLRRSALISIGQITYR